jgi:adiponectin receptor
VSIAPLLVNLASAAFCLGCSAIFHLYFVRSAKIADVLSRLDYGGISVLIFGSAVPVISYGFSCEAENTQRWLWLAAQGILCGTCFVVTLIKQFD